MVRRTRCPYDEHGRETVDGILARDAATAETMKRLDKRFDVGVHPKTQSLVLFQDIGSNPAAVENGWTRAIAFMRAPTR